MSDTASQGGKKPDLETQIREAEQRVVAADRDWRRHNDALAEAVRGKAGRAAKVGGAGLGVATAGLLATLALRWTLGAKKARARDRFFAETVSRLRQAPAPRPAPPPVGVPAAVARSPRWHAVVATLGTLLGAAATGGLGLAGVKKGGGVLSMLLSVAMPIVTRLLRGQTPPRR